MKKLFALCFIILSFGAGRHTCGQDFKKEVPFEPFEPPVSYEAATARAERIIGKMSLEEKIEMIGGHSIFFTKGYEKYGIPSMRFSDATQGVSLIDYKDHLEKSVAFPAPLALTSTWNVDLARAYAKSVGEECRAGGIGVLLGPGMNMYRISQCGRNFEYFGEDPFLAARMIENYVVGLQNTGVVATLKHFIANNTDHRRRTSNSVVSERALREIYAPAFEAGINAGAMAVMTAYNQVNCEYCPHSKYVISKLLRKDLGFKWLVMSDWLSIWDAEKAIKSGLDLDMPGETEDGIYSENDPAEYLRREAPGLIEEGKVKEQDIDRMVKNIMATAFAMRFDEITVKDTSYLNNYDKHVEVALDTARQGIVLLKNDNQTLPFHAKQDDVILVTGRYVDKLAVGGGAAYVIGFDQVTLLDALKEQFGENVKHIEEPTDEEITEASVVIYSAATYDSEGSDVPFDLPEYINTDIGRIATLNDKTVVIIYTGGGKNMSRWNNEVPAILYCWYPGQVGNKALAEIIAGTTNPSGKLPITIERRFEDSPGYPYLPEGEELYSDFEFDMAMGKPVYDINYKEGIFAGYRWYEHKNIQPLYAFGHGLSYTTFEYSNLKTDAQKYTIGDDVLVKVDVTNTGKAAGKEIVQLYVRDLEATVERPAKELKDFEKVHLKAGEKKTVYFTLEKRDFAFWDEDTSSWKVEPGEFEIQIGASSADIKLKEKIMLTQISAQTPIGNGPYEPGWESLSMHQTPRWLKDGKFGIYTHFGIYCYTATSSNATWNSHIAYLRPNHKEAKEFYERFGKITPEFGYKDLIPYFKAEKFDAKEWAQLFKKAGAKFAGPVAEHHDGFAMWDTKWSKWNAANMGPKRDVVGELEKAIKAEGMKFVTAFHHAANWDFFTVWDKSTDAGNPEYADLYGQPHERGEPYIDEDFHQEWYGKLIEVVDKYGPDFVWFDYGLDRIREDYVKDFVAYYYNKASALDKEVIISYKGHDLPLGVGLLDYELGQEAYLTHYEWITDSSIDDQGAWGYIPNLNYKSVNRLVDNLVDRVSKNGYLLMNVGPKHDGTIPDGAKKGLLGMGEWLAINGEAIYGTRAWTKYGEGPTNVGRKGRGDSSFNEADLNYTGEDIRFTVKGDNLYAVVLDWPGEEVLIKSITAKSVWDVEGYNLYPGEIQSITMLGDGKELDWKLEKGKGLTIKTPDERPCEHAFVFKIVRKHR